MAVAAITGNINDDVFTEFLAIFRSDPCCIDHRFRIIPINMEYRRFDHKGHVRAILTRAILGGRRCKANLVVNDDMDRPACPVTDKLRHLEAFHDNALTGKGAITMKDNCHNLFGIMRLICTRRHLLFSARFPHHHRRYDFKVRWVWREREMHAITVKFAVI